MIRYDYVFSIGEACSCALLLKKNSLRRYSGPFDWLWGCSLHDRVKLIMSDFQDFLTKEYFEHYDDPGAPYNVFVNTKTDIHFNHDFAKEHSFEANFPDFEAKYKRRIERFLKILKSRKKVLLVYLQCPDLPGVVIKQKNDLEDIKLASKEINEKYPNIDILYINHNENMKDLEYTFDKIEDNLYYAECFNYVKGKIERSNNSNYDNVSQILSKFEISNKKWSKVSEILRNISYIFYKEKLKYKRILWFRIYRK